MLNMSEAEWDLVFQVHCKGSFAPAHFAGNYWKNKSKETGQPQDGRIIVTSSIVGLNVRELSFWLLRNQLCAAGLKKVAGVRAQGNYGQSNYAAAKAANAMFGMTLAGEMDRYGVTVNGALLSTADSASPC